MRSYLLTLIALALFSASLAEGAFSLNPFAWFSDEEEAGALDLRLSPEEEKAATERLERGLRAMEGGRTGAAKRHFRKVIKNYPKANQAAEARYNYAKILKAEERWVKAFDTFQEIIKEHPGFPEFNAIIASQFDCATALMEGARGKILWVIPGFKQYGKASDGFEQIVNNAPYNDYAPLALMNIALLAEKRNNPDQAIDALDRLINFYPQNRLAPEAYYNLAETYSKLVKGPEYDQGSTRQAIRYCEDFLILFPESEYVNAIETILENMENILAKSRLNLGNFYYYYRNNSTAALVFYNEAITLAPDSETAEEAKERVEDIENGVRPTTPSGLLRKLLLAD